MTYRFWKLDENGHETRSREITFIGGTFTSLMEAKGFRILSWGKEGIIELSNGWFAEKM